MEDLPFAAVASAAQSAQQTSIQFDWLNILLSIGVLGILGAFIYIGRKLQILDSLEGIIKDEVRPDLKDVRDRLSTLEGKYAGAFGSASPISLKPPGIRALEESGFKKWIDDHKQELMDECRGLHSMANPYDIQEAAFKFFDNVDLKDFDEKLKSTAYSFGWSIQTMRRVGGIYFRDLCLEAAGFRPEDLDGEAVI